MTDLELMELLEAEGYEPDLENLITLKEGLENGNFEILDEKIRFGAIGNNNGNNLAFKYRASDITVESLVDDYFTHKNFAGRIDVSKVYLRTAARADAKCEEIRAQIKAEVSKPDQNKVKVDSLRNAYFAALDRLYTKESKEGRDAKNKKYIIKESKEVKTAGKIAAAGAGAGVLGYAVAVPARSLIILLSGLGISGIAGLAALSILASVPISKIASDNNLKKNINFDFSSENKKRLAQIAYEKASKDSEILRLKGEFTKIANQAKTAGLKSIDKESRAEIKRIVNAVKARINVLTREARINVVDDRENKALTEMFSDYELYQILESNGYTTTEENLSILKEGLETGKYYIED